MRFLGIDAGATYLKGAVLDVTRRRVERVVRTPFPPFIPDSAGTRREVEPELITLEVARLLDRLWAEAPDCVGLVLCGQMHGVVLVSEDGTPLSRFISWQDERAGLEAGDGRSWFQVLESRLDNRARQETGNELRVSLPVSALFAAARMGQLPDVPFIPCALGDFVAASLCRTAPVTEATNAAAHGCYDVARQTWHTGMIEAADLPGGRFPSLVPAGTAVGNLSERWGRIPCYVSIGDQQAALLGAALQPGELSLNIATGSQVSMLSETAHPGDYQVRPFFDGLYLRTITHIPAGRALNVLVRLVSEVHEHCRLAPDDVWRALEAAVERVEATDLQVDLSFFSGALGDRGSIANIREENLSLGHLFRAGIESMALNYRRCAQRVSPERAWRRLLFSGGLVLKLPALRKAILRRFNDPPHRFPPVTEDTLQGLAYLAAACSFPGTKLLPGEIPETT